MQEFLSPLRADSLTEVFVERFEDLIISGKVTIGQKLPSERELAQQLEVSRPVVHEGLVTLAARGLVSLIPRVGCFVNDFRRNGSLALLNSLVNYEKGRLDPHLLKSMLDMRVLFETENARLAAKNRTSEHMREFRTIIDRESQVDASSTVEITEIDFHFHLLIAIATGNLIYPMLLNSFKQVYTSLTGQFFSDRSVTDRVFGFHRRLVNAIDCKSEQDAIAIMQEILRHGEEHLTTIIAEQIGRNQ